MNILITGSCGYLGQKTCEILCASKEISKVVGIDIIKAPKNLLNFSNYVHHKSDIRDKNILEISKKENIDVIIHLASILNPPEGMSEEELESIEIDGAKNLLDVAVKINAKKFIFMSSGAVYGYFPENPSLIKEDYRVKGSKNFPYSLHKAHVEMILDDYKNNYPELSIMSLRAGTILGHKSKGPIADYFNKKFLFGVKGFKSPFCFIYDEDVVQAIYQGVVNTNLKGAYNLSGDGSLSLKQVAQKLGSIYFELPEKFIKKAISILKKMKLTQYNSYQIDFISYRPVLDNQKLKNDFKGLPTKTSEEVFEIFKSSR